MLKNLNPNSKKVTDAFGLDLKDWQTFHEFVEMCGQHAKKGKRRKLGTESLLWLIERIWVDETLNDNQRCFYLFMTGRFYEASMKEFGEF